MEELLSVVDDENNKLLSENEDLKRRCFSLKQRCIKAENQIPRSENETRDLLRTLPVTNEEALSLAAKIWQDRIVVLPSALKSIEEWQGEVIDAWNVITSVPCVLWELLFKESSVDFCKEFKHRTGFELTLREGKETRRRPDLMRLRTQTYDGRQVVGEAHVKGHGRKGGIRLHYYVDDERKLVVITHCGQHLKTAGTKRKGY